MTNELAHPWRLLQAVIYFPKKTTLREAIAWSGQRYAPGRTLTLTVLLHRPEDRRVATVVQPGLTDKGRLLCPACDMRGVVKTSEGMLCEICSWQVEFPGVNLVPGDKPQPSLFSGKAAVSSQNTSKTRKIRRVQHGNDNV